jgi:hypothetical protein
MKIEFAGSQRMRHDLDHMFRVLKDARVDHALDGLASDVGQRLAERRTVGVQTWGIRAAAVAVVTMTGVAVSASSTAATAHEPSPFSAWSELAPSTLLGGSQ